MKGGRISLRRMMKNLFMQPPGFCRFVFLEWISIDTLSKFIYFLKRFGVTMLTNFTAKYIKTENGYMGQLIEWPQVITEGKTLEDCRESLKDALHEMILAFQQLGKEIPTNKQLFEPLAVELPDVR
jgi:predicted RNase H-like HicB family nuclease